ncbi:MAG: preprotein translocase subunit SecY [Mycoplasma sp.]|nr:preprotein translocase subunit SecY [Mycoplasma sp.]
MKQVFSKVGKNSKKLWKKFKSRQLLARILFTILLISIFRVAATITVPGVKLREGGNSTGTSFLSLLNLLGGGAITKFSIVALGISPYITASIIVQILTTDAFPPLAKLAKSGQAGRRKINVLTRWITIAFGIMQGFALAASMVNDTTGTFEFVSVIGDSTIVKYLFVVTILLAGSLFTLFLGERITERGVGNGTSLIIFSGIAATLPTKFESAFQLFVGTHADKAIFVGVVDFIGYCLFFLLIMSSILFVYISERRIPIQQTGRAMSTQGEKLAFLPIKLNPAGVVPVIFASALISIPLTVSQFLPKWWNTTIWMQANLTFTAPVGLSLYIGLIVIFTLFWSQVQTNPDQIAENFQKSSTFIPGVRPGQETRGYVSKVILRLSIVSSIYLAVIAGLPYFEALLGFPNNVSVGGTGTIILITVGIETIKNINSRRTTVNLTKHKVKTKRAASGGEIKNEGLLW